MIHVTEGEREGGIKATTKARPPQLHIAPICAIRLITHCSGTAALSSHYHYLLSIMALLLILNLLTCRADGVGGHGVHLAD